MKKSRSLSQKVQGLSQSAIRAASVRCAQLGGINMGQGLCDIPAQDMLKEAAAQAIYQNKNLYAAHQGLAKLRERLAEKIKKFNQVSVDPETEILISAGSTGAYASAVKALFNPGDHVILFEPFYGYHANLLKLLDMEVSAIPMSPKDFSIDFDQLEKAIKPNTKGIVVCTPCNPTGKVFSKAELIQIGELAKKYQLYVITDEIYEYITYPGYEHVSLASLDDYKEFTVTISGFSKTYNVTGWRVGYAYGPAEIIEKMSLIHDLLYICAPTPLQHALAEALTLPESYYEKMRAMFLQERDFTLGALREIGFEIPTPEGAYYLMADAKSLGWGDDHAVAKKLLEEAKVAVVPGRSFYLHPEKGSAMLRFCFALEQPKLTHAMENIGRLRDSR